MERASGILLHITSLPSKYGIGTLGKEAFRFVDFLSQSGQRFWQMFPLGPTGCGDSPYQSFSSYAGNPYLIDLDLLADDDLLDRDVLDAVNWGDKPDQIDYGKIYQNRFGILKQACDICLKRERASIDRFLEENNRWLPDYALFMALKRHFGMCSWLEWPQEDIRLRIPSAMERYRHMLCDDVNFFVCLQYLFFKQWEALREYCKSKNVALIGDMPFYVSVDSADLWSEPEYFQVDAQRRPVCVAGVPPDYFSETGQLWGNPLYDWKAMAADGYGWWIRRIDMARHMFDWIRLDHFRGFESYWSVPAGDETAEHGHWEKGPGLALTSVLRDWFFQTKFIAENLGMLTPEVEKLLVDTGFPGMEVLQFAFGTGPENTYLPHNHIRNAICYTGTHDNQTLNQWAAEADEVELCDAGAYFAVKQADLPQALIRAGMASVSALFISRMQDWLGTGAEGRINCPGTTFGNWRWRLRPNELTDELAAQISEMTKRYGRQGLAYDEHSHCGRQS